MLHVMLGKARTQDTEIAGLYWMVMMILAWCVW